MSSERDRIEQYRRWIGEWFRQYDRPVISGNRAMWHRACAVEEALMEFERLFPRDDSPQDFEQWLRDYIDQAYAASETAGLTESGQAYQRGRFAAAVSILERWLSDQRDNDQETTQ